MDDKLKGELEALQGTWKGGYFGGDPLNPLGRSTYGQLGFLSVSYATYLRCIKPYVHADTVALEIGPGRGAWTKTLLPAREIYALDALPEEHNRFFEYLGHPRHVKYFQVQDFKCTMLPENYFDYMFSYGCMCHISFDGIREYAVNLFPKLKGGSNCFWMIADYDKYNDAVARLDELSIWSNLSRYYVPTRRRYLPLKWALRYLMRRERVLPIAPDLDDQPRAGGRWYHAGVERTCAMLEQVGYRIVDPDVGTCLRDPVIHFVKP